MRLVNCPPRTALKTRNAGVARVAPREGELPRGDEGLRRIALVHQEEPRFGQTLGRQGRFRRIAGLPTAQRFSRRFDGLLGGHVAHQDEEGTGGYEPPRPEGFHVVQGGGAQARLGPLGRVAVGGPFPEEPGLQGPIPELGGVVHLALEVREVVLPDALQVLRAEVGPRHHVGQQREAALHVFRQEREGEDGVVQLHGRREVRGEGLLAARQVQGTHARRGLVEEVGGEVGQPRQALGVGGGTRPRVEGRRDEGDVGLVAHPNAHAVLQGRALYFGKVKEPSGPGPGSLVRSTTTKASRRLGTTERATYRSCTM